MNLGSLQIEYVISFPPYPYVSLNVYLLIPAPNDPLTTLFRTWETPDQVPKFVLEVVSNEIFEKDYDSNPQLYDQLGVDEYCIVDAGVAAIRDLT